MCLSPIILPNPNYGIKNCRKVKDVHSSKIVVPCGVCPACSSMRQTDFLERCELMSLDHDLYFGTLTYRPLALPHTRIFEHKDGSKRWYDYADVRDFRLMMKRIRKTYFHNKVDIKYLAVSEYGGTTHRPHFHFILFVPRKHFVYWDKDNQMQTYSPSKYDSYNIVNFEANFWDIFLLEWRRNISKSTKKPKWQQLCFYVEGRDGRSTYDFHYVEPLTKNGKRSSTVAKYVTKYILKFDKWLINLKHGIYNNLEYEDYKELWKCLRPRVLCSLFLGVKEKPMERFIVKPIYKESSLDYVRKGIDWSKSTSLSKGFPVFFDVETGKSMPLGKYLRHHFITQDDNEKLISIRKVSEGQDPNGDLFVLDKYTKEQESGNWDYYEKEISRYRKIHAYLEECNRSDCTYVFDYG